MYNINLNLLKKLNYLLDNINYSLYIKKMTSQLHNTKVYINNTNYREILEKNIKTRNEYLDNNNVILMENKVKRKHKILFLSNDMSESLSFHDYKLIIHGILPCGSKTTLILNNIYPYVDIEYNESMTNDENLNYLKHLFKDETLKKSLKNKSIDVKDIKILTGRKLMLYSDKESKFIRIRFKKLFHRNSFIKVLIKNNIESFNNDISSYYRVVSRTYKINLTGWNTLENYKIVSNSNYKSKYTFEMNIYDMKPYNDTMYDEFQDIDINLIRKDKMISMAFDIEQYSSDFDIDKPNKETRLPSGKVPGDVIFNIGLTYQFINEINSFLNIGLVTKEADAHPDYFTIVCKNEKILLLAFGFINSLLQPDFIYEFNGSNFDWPNMYDKYEYHYILDTLCQDMSLKHLSAYELKKENIEKYYFQSEYIKIAADKANQKMANIKLPGYVAFDVRVIFMQQHPLESKSSLKFYLAINNLPSKDDMPIKDLFGYYFTGDVKGLTEVVHYCYIDCYRLHQLVFQNNIIQDRRAVSSVAYTSMFDALYRANGGKVRNLIIANAIDKKLFVSNIKKEEREEDKMIGRFTGALVIDPTKGLVSNLMTFEEFAKDTLKIDNQELINQVQEVINQNYEAVYIKKDLDKVKF